MYSWADDDSEMDFSLPPFNENIERLTDSSTDNYVVNLDTFLQKYPQEFVPIEKLKRRLSIFKKLTNEKF